MTIHPGSLDFIADWNDLPAPAPPTDRRYRRRALSLWPRLDGAQLRRAHDDPWRIARIVALRTALPFETIVELLLAEDGAAAAGEEPAGRH